MTSKQTTKPIEHSIIQSMTKQELAQYLSNLCERYLEEPLEIDKDHLVNLFSGPMNNFIEDTDPIKLKSLKKIVEATETELQHACDLTSYINNKQLRQDILLSLLAVQMGLSAVKEKQRIR